MLLFEITIFWGRIFNMVIDNEYNIVSTMFTHTYLKWFCECNHALFRIINVNCQNTQIDQRFTSCSCHSSIQIQSFCLVTFPQKYIVDLGFFVVINSSTKIDSHSAAHKHKNFIPILKLPGTVNNTAFLSYTYL